MQYKKVFKFGERIIIFIYVLLLLVLSSLFYNYGNNHEYYSSNIFPFAGKLLLI